MDSNQVSEVFPHLKNVNKQIFDSEKAKKGKFFVIRSSNDDDVHKVFFIIRQLNTIYGHQHQIIIFCLISNIMLAKQIMKMCTFFLVL